MSDISHVYAIRHDNGYLRGCIYSATTSSPWQCQDIGAVSLQAAVFGSAAHLFASRTSDSGLMDYTLDTVGLHHLAQSVLTQTISVTDPAFGAKGNGISDDTSAIQNAIAAAVSRGATLLLPSGKYLVSSVQFNANQSILANHLHIVFGPGATIIGSSAANPASPPLQIHGIGDDFQMSGPGTITYRAAATSRQQASAALLLHGSVSAPMTNVSVTGITITNAPNWSLFISPPTGRAGNQSISVQNVAINSSYGDGVHISYANNDVVVSNVTGTNLGDDLVAVLSDSLSNFVGPTYNVSVQNVSGQNIGGSVVHLLGVTNGSITNISGTATTNPALQPQTRGVSLLGDGVGYDLPNKNISLSNISVSGFYNVVAAGWYSSVDQLTMSGINGAQCTMNGIQIVPLCESQQTCATVGTVNIGSVNMSGASGNNGIGIVIRQAAHLNINEPATLSGFHSNSQIQ